MNHFLSRSSEVWWNWVTEATWQSTIVGIVLLAIVSLGQRWSSPLRYALLLVVLLKFSVPPLISAPTGVFGILGSLSRGDDSKVVSELESGSNVPNSSDEVADDSNGFVKYEMFSPRESLETDSRFVGDHSKPGNLHVETLAENSHGSDQPNSNLVAGKGSVTQAGSSIWMTLRGRWRVGLMLLHFAGSVFVVASILRQVMRLKTLIRQAGSISASMIQLRCDELQQMLQIRRPVRLVMSSKTTSPMAFGVLSPTIVLPSDVATMSPNDLTSILAHELLHLRRRDSWVNWLQLMVAAVWWFNPVVWVLNRSVRQVREDCCDDALLVSGITTNVDYCETLLRIVSKPDHHFRSGLTCSMAGRLHPIGGRLRRIMDTRLPRAIKLSTFGLVVVLLVAGIVLPGRASAIASSSADTVAITSDTDEAVEQDTDANPDNKQVAVSLVTPPRTENAANATVQTATQPAALSGRIVDESGVPVTDATLTLRGAYNQEAKTDNDGRYLFQSVRDAEEFRVEIQSLRCVSLNYWAELPRVDLAPGTHVEKNFTLKLASQVRIRTIDEAGIAVKGVRIYSAALDSENHRHRQSASTDNDGWTTIGGLAPSKAGYIFGCQHNEYAIEKLIHPVTQAGTIAETSVIMRQGISVKGNALCSDDKPPAGWRILALPEWWQYGASPIGDEIPADGSFELKHIVPGEYDVTISVLGPDEGSFQPHTVLSKSNLLATEQPLALKMDYPSAASLVYITGTIVFTGEAPKGIWLHARSKVGNHHSGFYARPEKPNFRLGPFPAGLYALEASEPLIESVTLNDIPAPTEDLKITVVGRGKPRLRGRVLVPPNNAPASDFRIRITKFRTLEGPNYVEDSTWRHIEDSNGEFSVEVNSPGVYSVAAIADGFAPTLSEPISTNAAPAKALELILTKGGTIQGTIVDESGSLISDAVIVPQSMAQGHLKAIPGPQRSVNPSVISKDGLFTLENLPAGSETLYVTHPDFSESLVKNIDIISNTVTPLRITLTKGGTIRGQVFDENGKPGNDVRLRFQDRNGYGGTDDELAGRLAFAVTDSEGRYEVQRLPEQLVYISRADEWTDLGVVRQTVKVQNGHVHNVNLGGPQKFSGRILINGQPLSNNRIQLGGDSPTFGIMKAYTTTNDRGEFLFFGPPPGIWTLYYNIPGDRSSWMRLQDVQIPANSTLELGEIRHLTGTVTVRSVPENPATLNDLRYELLEYDPVWTWGRAAGIERPRQSVGDPVIFDHVSPGDFELVCYWRDHAQTRQRLTIAHDSLGKTVEIQLPVGTASLSGTADRSICGPGGCSSLKLWSSDHRWLTYINPDERGRFQLNQIPAGTWFLCEHDVRNAHVVQTIVLEKDESKTLNLSTSMFAASSTTPGFGMISTLSPDGVPTPCLVSLEGPNGLVPIHANQNAEVAFVSTDGEYTALVQLAGFKTVKQRMRLIKTVPDGRIDPASRISIQLERE